MPQFRRNFFSVTLAALLDGMLGHALLCLSTGDGGQWRLLPPLLLAGACLRLAEPAWRDLLPPAGRPALPRDAAPPAAALFTALGLSAAGWLMAMTAGFPGLAAGGGLLLLQAASGAGLGRVAGAGALMAGLTRGLGALLGMCAHPSAWPAAAAGMVPLILLAAYGTLAGLAEALAAMPPQDTLARLAGILRSAGSSAAETANPDIQPESAAPDGPAGSASPKANGPGPEPTAGDIPDPPSTAGPGMQVRADPLPEEMSLPWEAVPGHRPVARLAPAACGLALAALPLAAAWLATPAGQGAPLPESWFALGCLGILFLFLLAGSAGLCLRPTLGRLRRFARGAAGAGSLLHMGLAAGALRYWPAREPYPGFTVPLPALSSLPPLAAVAVLALLASTAGRTPKYFP